jgi:hypothetical protein
MCNQCTRPSRVLIGELENIISGEYDLAPAPPAAPRPVLSKHELPIAVAGNRRSAPDIHWGCFAGGNIRVSDDILDLLHLPTGTAPDERRFANAVAAYQRTKNLPPTGIVDDQTWKAILADRPVQKFKPLVIPVIFNGAKLGFIEKTKPYLAKRDDSLAAPEFASGGAELQLGFRITDPEAVRKAGFSDNKGRPPFRWIQTIEFVANRLPHIPFLPPMYIRRHHQVIDPTSLTAGTIPDKHPYYWDEETPRGAPETFHINNFINQTADNHLCYDLIFEDSPQKLFLAAKPGQRSYFNVETALVGIDNQGDPTRNTILDTFTWGYDLVVEKGKTEVRLNHLGPGIKGGSPTFKQIMSKQIGDFPHHCFVGSGFSKAATCK